MASIKETLEKIPDLLNEVEKELEGENFDAEFLVSLNNFLGTYYFDLLAHVSCSQLATEKAPAERHSKVLQKYSELAANPLMLEEKIRIDNIQGLFFLWVVFEQFVFRNAGGTSKKAGDFQDAHRRLMESKGINRKRVKAIEAVTDGVRRTRNSLHSNGVYGNTSQKSFELSGKEYVLEPGKPVQPLRLVSVVEFCLSHYRELKAAPDSC